jgi:thioredoxin reductase
MAAGKFLIRRTDQRIDDISIDSDGLTIGRLSSNDLVLNHRAVEDTCAGIREIEGHYWLSNLSSGNGLIVNGSLVERARIAKGDVLQAGPYLLRFAFDGDRLEIAVEASAGLQISHSPTPDQARGPGNLPPATTDARDEQALTIFWDKRMRESGKIAGKALLNPRGRQRLGKALTCWTPTLDLQRPWRASHFVWGASGAVLLALVGLIALRSSYSPGELASPHMASMVPVHNVALRAAGGSCSSCHSMKSLIAGEAGAMQSRCAACHNVPAFAQTISAAHQKAGMDCADCHTEHRGREAQAGLTRIGLCEECHSAAPMRQGQRAGEILGLPHNGRTGYPVVNGVWRWKGFSGAEWRSRDLPEYLARRPPAEQFHAVHRAVLVTASTGNRMECGDCHGTGTPGKGSGPAAFAKSCQTCHSDGDTPRCISCHPPHGLSGETRSLLAAAGGDFRNLEQRVLATQSAVRRRVSTANQTKANRASQKQSESGTVGGLPPMAWFGIMLIPAIGVVGRMATGSAALRSYFAAIRPSDAEPASVNVAAAAGPGYPHPVINPLLCIGCHACVDACPHDVLAIVNGVARPVALDQCMEDGSCAVECPTHPKACIIMNGTKVIPTRRVPRRNHEYETDAPGIYLIGDVSGIPLIKNAINEGHKVIDHVIDDIQEEAKTAPVNETEFPFDVAIIGVGSGGFSAAVSAREAGLKYAAIEQGRLASTLRRYPAGKYVFFKPDTTPVKGLVPLGGVGMHKEDLLNLWGPIAADLGVRELERCTGIERIQGGFDVTTHGEAGQGEQVYRARRIIIAIGNSGSPMKLGVPGEALKGRVKYSLSDPDDYQGKKCIVVGAGNSAIEAAVDLAGLRRSGDQIEFIRDNEVTLVVRSDFKGDLKLGNKMNIYDCMDAGKVKVIFRTTIKEITDGDVVLADSRSGEETVRMANEAIFALVGSERPTKFLEKLGIHIEGGEKKGEKASSR